MNKAVGEIFDIIAEQDFNPDFVITGMMDSYDIGKNVGLAIGIGVGVLTGTAITIGVITYKNRKERSYVR